MSDVNVRHSASVGPMTTFRCWPDTCFPTLHRQINSGGKIISLSISFKRFPSPALFQTTVTVCKFCLKVSFLSFTHSKPFRPWVPYCWIVWRHSFAYHTWLPQNSWSSGLVGQNYAYLLVYKGHKVSASVSNCTTGAVGLGPIIKKVFSLEYLPVWKHLSCFRMELLGWWMTGEGGGDTFFL